MVPVLKNPSLSPCVLDDPRPDLWICLLSDWATLLTPSLPVRGLVEGGELTLRNLVETRRDPESEVDPFWVVGDVGKPGPSVTTSRTRGPALLVHLKDEYLRLLQVEVPESDGPENVPGRR